MSFDRFWEMYPRRVGKIDAMKAWAQAMKLTDPETVIRAVEFQRGYWKDPQYIPYPATWLRAGRWMDELQMQPHPKKAPAPLFDEGFTVVRDSAREWARAQKYCPHKPHCADPGGDACYQLWKEGKAS